MEYQIIETSSMEINHEQYGLLRRMTLENESMMRTILDSSFGCKPIPIVVAIASSNTDWLTPVGTYLGWALVDSYDFIGNKKNYVQVFVKTSYRQNGIGRRLVNQMRDRYQALGLGSREQLYCYRWDEVSSAFYDSLNMIDVWRGL